jgi:ketosteroid isomerase-like protein
MKKNALVLIVIACCSALTTHSYGQEADKAVADMSDDYTEFNGDYATRLEGKTMNAHLAEAAGKDSTKNIAAEMANPKVQVYNGNVAILTYNYVGLSIDKDGKTTPSRAKSTRVYVKKDNKWMLVHANFGTDPLPK